MIGFEPLELTRELNRNPAIFAAGDWVADYKNSDITPLEAIAVLPVKVWYDLMQPNKYNLLGFDSPYHISRDIHKNAHIGAVKYVTLEGATIFKRKFKKDVKLGNIKTFDKESLVKWRDEQEVEGVKYMRLAIASYRAVLQEIKTVGQDSFDYNDMLLKWQNLESKRFRELSEVAKAAGTLWFLRGLETMQDNIARNSKFPLTLPPFSLDKKLPNVIDADVMQIFGLEYTRIILNESRRSLDAPPDKIKYGKTIKKLIEEGCKSG